MMNSMIYKGYTARVEFDPRDDIFVGRVLGSTGKHNISWRGGYLERFIWFDR